MKDTETEKLIYIHMASNIQVTDIDDKLCSDVNDVIKKYEKKKIIIGDSTLDLRLERTVLRKCKNDLIVFNSTSKNGKKHLKGVQSKVINFTKDNKIVDEFYKTRFIAGRSDIVIVIWDGKDVGLSHVVRTAMGRGKKIIVLKINRLMNRVA